MAHLQRRGGSISPCRWFTLTVIYIYTYSYWLVTLQLPYMRITPKNQADEHTGKSKYHKEHRCSRTFTGAKQHTLNAVWRLYFHKRHKYIIHQNSACQIANWNGKKLQCIPGRINTPLPHRRWRLLLALVVYRWLISIHTFLTEGDLNHNGTRHH